MSLYQVAGRLDDAACFRCRRVGTAWLLDNMVYHDDWGGPTNGSDVKVGSAALMTIALAERRLLTGETIHDEVMRSLGRFMFAQQKPNGGFFTKWYVRPGRWIASRPRPIIPGEALWALALLHEAFPGEGWDSRPGRRPTSSRCCATTRRGSISRH